MCYFQTINSMAHMKRTKYGKVDLDYVLGIGGFDLERYRVFFTSFCYDLIAVEVLGAGFVTLVYCWWWLIGLSFQN